MQVIEKVDALEAAGSIAELVEDLPPEKLLDTEPEPGEVVAVQELAELGAKELKLSNGMVVVFRHSNLQEDQILLSVRSKPLLCGIAVVLSCMMATIQRSCFRTHGVLYDRVKDAT